MTASLPATMRAAVLHDWGGPLRLEERPVPRPGPGEVLVRVVACGAGLTLQHFRNGEVGGRTPTIMGHELGGIVVVAGAGVDERLVGQRVTGSFYLTCGRCRWCASGRETLCEDWGGFVGIHADGAFADYAVLPARNLISVPAGMDLGVAGVVSDAVATPYHAARRRARLAPGQRAAVLGAGGGVGVHMVGMARAFGAEVVAVERDPAKVERLRALGLTRVVQAGDELTGDELADAAGGRLDAVFDLVTTPATIQLGYDALGRGGTLVIIGARAVRSDVVVPVDMLNKETTITGSRYATRAEIREALTLVAAGRVPVQIGARFALEEIGDAFAAIEAQRVFGRIVVDVAAEKSLNGGSDLAGSAGASHAGS